MKRITVPGGDLEACPESQGAGALRVILVQLISRRQAKVSQSRITLIDPEEIRAVALIVEEKATVRGLIAPSLRKAEGAVVILDEPVKNPAALENVGDLEAELETAPDPEATYQVEAIRLAVQRDVLVSGAVVDVVVCNVDNEGQFLASRRKNPGIADGRQAEDLDDRALVRGVKGEDIERITGKRDAEQQGQGRQVENRSAFHGQEN